MGSPVRKPLDIEALSIELKGFEACYAMPSERRADAFTSPSGRLVENPDFVRWDFVYSILRRAGQLPYPVS